MDARELSHHDGAAAPRGLGRDRQARPPDVRPVDAIDVDRAVLLLRRRLGLEPAR